MLEQRTERTLDVGLVADAALLGKCAGPSAGPSRLFLHLHAGVAASLLLILQLRGLEPSLLLAAGGRR